MIFELKQDCNIDDLTEIQPALLVLFTNAVLYCSKYKLPLKVTSIISDRANIKAVSKTHNGRAIDISTIGWTTQHIHRFVFMFNRDYSDIAAISASDLIPRAAIYHDAGYGAHIHLQVRPNADLERFVKY